MKQLTLITAVFLMIISSSTGQNTEIEKIDKSIIDLEIKQKELNKEQEQIQLKIDSLNDVRISLQESKYFGEAFICIQSSYVFLTPKADYGTGYLLKKNEKVLGIESVNEWYKILHKEKEGYILKEAIESINKIEEDKLRAKRNDSIRIAQNEEYRLIQEKEKERLRAEREKERKRLLAERKKRLTNTYGVEIANKILDRRIWIGMTREMARESWGTPRDNNRTVTANEVSEQWVYGSTYLYFTNGILTAWQD